LLDSITRPQSLLAAKAKYDKSHRFNNIYYFICRQNWIEEALRQVLANKGSGTAGIDGQTIRQLSKPETKAELVQIIRTELRTKTYTPMPARRTYIPKANGKRRPLGIPTIKDRTVQCLLKMLLEPIYESDFLDCSLGFRPMRRTMDCIASCYVNINSLHKYYWVIEGCFDHIHHEKLLRILRRRISDRHVINLIDKLLNAGIMEGTLFKHSAEGVPQGGICSPLLANLYLNEMDRWWYDNYFQTDYRRYRRRKNGFGNYVLVRYADDFIMLCNGNRKYAEDMKVQLQSFLKDELQLKLSMEKTEITHVQDGFDFLGFHIQQRHKARSEGDGKKLFLLVKPSRRNIVRLMRKIKFMTAHSASLDNDYNKILAINAMLRGWSEYYKHVSSSRTFQTLDYWTEERLVRWLSDKHKLGIRRAVHRFQKFQNEQGRKRRNIGVQYAQDKILWLYKMLDKHITKYRRRKCENPFFAGAVRDDKGVSPITETDMPLLEQEWNGNAKAHQWRDVRDTILERDLYLCANPSCKSPINLDVHHIIPKLQRPDLALDVGNLITLCEKCHWAVHRGTLRLETISSDDGEPNA
jgi:RNA-directed DNA polymerase